METSIYETVKQKVCRPNPHRTEEPKENMLKEVFFKKKKKRRRRMRELHCAYIHKPFMEVSGMHAEIISNVCCNIHNIIYAVRKVILLVTHLGCKFNGSTSNPNLSNPNLSSF
jgi:hypothetical protein